MSRLVKLPYSGHRRDSGPFCALILSVTRLAKHPFACERVILRPGKTIRETALWPTPRAPKIPVLVECTISPRSRAGVCRFKGEMMYILWRYEHQEWIEVSRCYDREGAWWSTMHPLIVRELARSDAQPKDPDLAVISSQTAQYLDDQIRDLNGPERAQMLTSVHDQLAARIAAADVEFHADAA